MKARTTIMANGMCSYVSARIKHTCALRRAPSDGSLRANVNAPAR